MRALLTNKSLWFGFAAGIISLFTVAWFFGPRVDRFEEDPLTGRHRRTIEWMGATIHQRIEENEVSRWADTNGIQGIYYARFGWSPVSIEQRQWFGPTGIGCGGHGIPGWIYHGDLAIDGMTREEVLRSYQQEIKDSWEARRSLEPVLEKWSARLKR